MSVDHTQVVFYSGFPAYQNINVYTTTIEVSSVPIASGDVEFFDTVINVEPNSTFVTMAIQANETTGSGPYPPTALRWQTYPSSDKVFIALGTDPDGAGSTYAVFTPIVNDDQVTLRLTAGNPFSGNMAFTPISVGVQYAIHTID
jgi:hypothetical protein